MADTLLSGSDMRRQGLPALLLPLLILFVGGCGEGTRIVPLLTAAGVPLAAPRTAPLEVLTRSTAVRDPLPIEGSGVVYGDVEAALGMAVSSATVPWADAHRAGPGSKSGWQLSVELTNAEASYEAGRVIISLGVRATLRSRAGNAYLAQTQASCRQGGIVRPEDAAPVVYRCMTELGHNLDGWLDGVDLRAGGVQE